MKLAQRLMAEARRECMAKAEGPYTPIVFEPFEWIGALMLEQGSRTNGIGWKIVQMCNESGGERTLLHGCTARELWDAAQAWLDGYDAANRKG